MIKLLAEAGYTVISTPYAVTFKHTDCAAAVQEVGTIMAPNSSTLISQSLITVFTAQHSNVKYL